jgi:hypothetical protein
VGQDTCKYYSSIQHLNFVAVVSQFDLSRDGDTPIITGKRPIVDVPTLEDLEENDLKDLKTEAREFFEKMMKQKEGRDHFMKWLFRLADVDKTETIRYVFLFFKIIHVRMIDSTEELSLMLNALAKDGIMPESLCFDDGMQVDIYISTNLSIYGQGTTIDGSSEDHAGI